MPEAREIEMQRIPPDVIGQGQFGSSPAIGSGGGVNSGAQYQQNAEQLGKTVQLYFNSFKQKYLSAENSVRLDSVSTQIIIRPWLGEFCSIEKPRKFEVSQIVRNLNYFKFNYLAMDSVILCLGLLLNPTALFCLMVLGGGWLFFLSKNANPEWRTIVAGKEITAHHRNLIMIIVSVAYVIFFIGSLMLTLIGFGAIINCIHALCHMPSSDYRQVLENEELGGGGGGV